MLPLQYKVSHDLHANQFQENLRTQLFPNGLVHSFHQFLLPKLMSLLHHLLLHINHSFTSSFKESFQEASPNTLLDALLHLASSLVRFNYWQISSYHQTFTCPYQAASYSFPNPMIIVTQISLNY